jgi:hypothetical protein
VTKAEMVTHFLFMDDIFVSLYAFVGDMTSFKNILNLYCKSTCMNVNWINIA